MASTVSTQGTASAVSSGDKQPQEQEKSIANTFLDLQVPKVIKISPNRQHILYSTCYIWDHKKAAHVVSTIWLAETGKSQSARPLTGGDCNDTEPRWSPDGKQIAFLSDRAKPGQSSAIYILPLGAGSAEAYSVTPESCEKPISRCEFSPDGRYIAYISEDEKTGEQKGREKAKDDAQLWGEWSYNRLRLVDICTKKISTLIGHNAHVEDFAWNDSGREIAFAEVDTPDAESPMLDGTTISTVDVAKEEVTNITHVSHVIRHLVWAGSSIYFTAPAAGAECVNSSFMVYRVDLDKSPRQAKKYAHGEDDCAFGLSKAGGDVVAYVKRGVEDQLHIVGGHMMFTRPQAITAWDAAFTTDSDEVVLAIATSDINHPTEMFSTTASGGALVQLSNHGERGGLKDQNRGSCTLLSCQSSDDKVSLDALWLAPTNAPSGKPAPTVVLVHGGPYDRFTDRFIVDYFGWAPLLLAYGYHVLVPNYRGSSGRGQSFAAWGQRVGKEDYEDVITLTQHAIEQGLADREHLVIAGYSQGGYMSFLAAVRNGLHNLGWRFRAAIPGSGVSDQDSMIFTSDIGGDQADLAGIRPWKTDKNDTQNRKGSAIWEVYNAVQKGDVIPPMLILSGDADVRVHISQSITMRRALTDHKLPFEMVVYPGEGHIFKERTHLVDMAERVLGFVKKHI